MKREFSLTVFLGTSVPTAIHTRWGIVGRLGSSANAPRAERKSEERDTNWQRETARLRPPPRRSRTSQSGTLGITMWMERTCLGCTMGRSAF